MLTTVSQNLLPKLECSSQKLKEIFLSDTLSIETVKLVSLANINNITEDIGLCPLHWLCINTQITSEIIEYVVLNSNADFNTCTEIQYNVENDEKCKTIKKIIISPLAALCQNPSFTTEMMICLKDCKFAPSNYEKHKICSPIFTLCSNPNVNITMLKILYNQGYDLFQYSPFVKGESSFDKLFENPSVTYEIVKFILEKYELVILFTKTPIMRLFSNSSIDYNIINYFNSFYKRILEENFDIILKNPTIIKLNLQLVTEI